MGRSQWSFVCLSGLLAACASAPEPTAPVRAERAQPMPVASSPARQPVERESAPARPAGETARPVQPERAAPGLPVREMPDHGTPDHETPNGEMSDRGTPGQVEPDRVTLTPQSVTPEPAEQLTPSAGGDVTLGDAGLPTGDSLQPVGRQYARTGSIEHTFRKNGGRRTSVAFSLSFSAEPGELEAARAAVEDNWAAAVERAQGICELVDLTSEAGRFQCEAVLRQRLSDVFFTTVDGEQSGRVERVIWDRLTWR